MMTKADETRTTTDARSDGHWAGLGGEDLDDYPRQSFQSEAIWNAFLEGYWLGLDERQFCRWVNGK